MSEVQPAGESGEIYARMRRELVTQFSLSIGMSWEELTEADVVVMAEVLADMIVERRRQIDGCKHGGDTVAYDKTNSRNDWLVAVGAYTGRAGAKVARNEREGCTFRQNTIKAGALLVAATEAHDKGYC